MNVAKQTSSYSFIIIIRRLNMFLTWPNALKITLLLLLVSAIVVACFTLPIEKVFSFLLFHFWLLLIFFFRIIVHDVLMG